MVSLNGTDYSKTKAKEVVSGILNGYNIGDEVVGPHHDLLLDVLDYHPDAASKIGVGVKRFLVAVEPVYKGRGFIIERVDGSRIDFSFMKCLTQSREPHRKQVLRACRVAVKDQIVRFKKSVYGTNKYVRCCITQLNMQWKDCHIDHKAPLTFDTLVFNYLFARKLKLDDIVVIPDGTSVLFADQNLCADWCQYHQQHAVLQPTLDHANLGQPKVKVNWELLTGVQP